ncbi:unnamed protein product [Amoebophrya sp. A25]|nr:unnamed protein product [Amoebophrya sp. A25]|eukprot:GSA25T00011335001.1
MTVQQSKLGSDARTGAAADGTRRKRHILRRAGPMGRRVVGWRQSWLGCYSKPHSGSPCLVSDTSANSSGQCGHAVWALERARGP